MFPKHKYGISQSDMYQMFAYGHKYLRGRGTVYLIYPAYESFKNPLPPFLFDDQLSVKAVPYNLASDECEFVRECIG